MSKTSTCVLLLIISSQLLISSCSGYKPVAETEPPPAYSQEQETVTKTETAKPEPVKIEQAPTVTKSDSQNSYLALDFSNFDWGGGQKSGDNKAEPAKTEPVKTEPAKTDIQNSDLALDFSDFDWGANKATSRNTTKTITIGSQTWTAENLNVSTFRNGDAIPEVKTDAEWSKAYDDKKPAWCYYNNDPTNGAKYGKLYNWYAIIDPRGIAPAGWHIPSKSDWTILLNGFGEKVGKKMKSSSGWKDNGNGYNQGDFSALPGGYRQPAPDSFSALGSEGNWWSNSTSSMFGFELGNGLKLEYDNDEPVNDSFASEGLSVRCVKD